MAKYITTNLQALTYAKNKSFKVVCKNDVNIIYASFAQIRKLRLITDIHHLWIKNGRISVALDGDSASGKTTFGQELATLFNFNLISVDDFITPCLPKRQKQKEESGNNINFAALNTMVIIPYMHGEKLTYAPFNFKTHTHEDEVTLPYKRGLIIEGAFSLHPALNFTFDVRVLFKIRRCKQLQRICLRNGKDKVALFKKYWLYNERRYQKKWHIKKIATHIVSV